MARTRKHPRLKQRFPAPFPWGRVHDFIKRELMKITDGKRVKNVKLFGLREVKSPSVRGCVGLLVTERKIGNGSVSENVYRFDVLKPDNRGLITTYLDPDEQMMFVVRHSPFEILGYKPMPRSYFETLSIA